RNHRFSSAGLGKRTEHEAGRGGGKIVAGLGIEHRACGANARGKIYAYLERQPGGAYSEELVGLLVQGAGADPDRGPRIIHRLLDRDPNFVFDATRAMWTLPANDVLKVPPGDGRFVVVDLETTGGRPGPGAIIEIGAYRMEGLRMTESFASLVRPRGPISSFVTRLTSI